MRWRSQLSSTSSLGCSSSNANFYNKESLDDRRNSDLNIAPGNFAHTKGGAVELGQDSDAKRGVDNVEVAAK